MPLNERILKLLIIDNYDSFTYNLVQIIEQNGVKNFKVVKNDDLLGLNVEDYDKILISPGPGIAKEAGQLMPFLRSVFKTKSILGVCLGYEAIGELFGAKLTKMPHPMHGIQNYGTSLKNDTIFRGFPNKFKIGHYHSWIIEEQQMPDCLEITMKDENDLPMAFKHKEYKIRGLMFHPESIMTEFGKEIISNWLTF